MSALGDDPDPVDDAYRRASSADAGRPSAASRAAILAQARTVASQHREPANEPWFRRRSVTGLAASVAVLGLAAVLWRQTSRDPQIQATFAPEVATTIERKVEAETEAAPARNAAPEVFPQQQQAREPERAPPPPAATAAQDFSEATAAEPRTRSFGGAPGAPAPAARASPSPPPPPAPPADLRTIVQDAFPGLLQADRPPRAVWVLQDASGRTLRSGLVDDGANYGDLARRLQQETPTQRIGAFDVGDVITDRGTRVQVGIARVR
ncbi:MAG: hypothetical protein ABW136_12205 [Steroidobacteraceae bacterium]